MVIARPLWTQWKASQKASAASSGETSKIISAATNNAAWGNLQYIQFNLDPPADASVRSAPAVPALFVFLLASKNSDLNSLLQYWGRGGRETLIRPLLKSLTHNPEPATLNISHLLPPLARVKLYTFPKADEEPDGSGRDSFWGALNFFSDTPAPPPLDRAAALQRLATEYREELGPKRLGDVLLIKDKSGQPLHCCVHIADAVVFTRSGPEPGAPWVLMKFPDLLAKFEPESSLQITTLRSKRLP
ncbi:MAG TPA: hypothetical protein VGE41_12120 [Verrucomicrobiae bacterium]